jgi:hypothetical protein
MITVEDACITTVCSNCSSKNNRKEIRIGDFSNIHHVVFVLCESCLAELSVEIDRELV